MKSPTDTAECAILIVDDDVDDQTFVRRALSRSGVTSRVMAVNDGEEATAYLRGLDLYANRQLHPLPRLILTDLKMPRMSGLELLAWMNARPEFQLIPTIVLTSSNNQSDIVAAFTHGAKGYMIKPVQFPELEKMMRTIVTYWRTSCVPPLAATR